MELPIAIFNNEGKRGLVLHGSKTENMINFEQLTKEISIEVYLITFALSTFERPPGSYICFHSFYLVPLYAFISTETRLNDQRDISFSGTTTGQHGTNLGNVGLGSQTNNGYGRYGYYYGRRGGLYVLYMPIYRN